MSNLNRHIVLPAKAYTEPFAKGDDGLSPKFPPYHPYHPMRQADTIRVGSLREMWQVAPIGIEIPQQNEIVQGFGYALKSESPNKPEIDIRAEMASGQVLRIAATTTVPEEVLLVDGALDVVKGLVWRRVDALEAMLWFGNFYAVSATLNPPNPVRSFRELFAIARAFLARMSPYFSFTAMLTPKAYGAALLENSAGSAQNTSLSEPQVASGEMKLVPVALESLPSGPEPVIVYPTWITSLIKRYIYETEFVERVVDETAERNVQRVTCERYLAPVLPYFFYYQAEDKFIVPSVVIDASDAINEIASRYGGDALRNLEYAAQAS
jgi:hypothetical protein